MRRDVIDAAQPEASPYLFQRGSLRSAPALPGERGKARLHPKDETDDGGDEGYIDDDRHRRERNLPGALSAVPINGQLVRNEFLAAGMQCEAVLVRTSHRINFVRLGGAVGGSRLDNGNRAQPVG